LGAGAGHALLVPPSPVAGLPPELAEAPPVAGLPPELVEAPPVAGSPTTAAEAPPLPVLVWVDGGELQPAQARADTNTKLLADLKPVDIAQCYH